jgi:hypothetical protein
MSSPSIMAYHPVIRCKTMRKPLVKLTVPRVVVILYINATAIVTTIVRTVSQPDIYLD